MMTVEQIVDGILDREGSVYSDDAADAGGPTRHGITLGDWALYTKQPATPAMIQALTEEQAREYYRQRYIMEPGFWAIHDDWLRVFLIDTAVLEGIGTAIKMLQKAVGVKADGVLGPVTFAATAMDMDVDPGRLRNQLLKTRLNHLIGVALKDVPLAVVNGTNLRWIRGWTNRVMGFL